jgi:hypothetical protein
MLTRPKLSDIDEQIRQKLSGVKLHKVENYLSKMEKGERIVLFNNNLVKLFDQEHWKSIAESPSANRYELIFERV